MARWRFREPSIIPGFRLTFGFTIFYLSIIVLIPIIGLYLHTLELDWPDFVRIVTGARFMAAFQLSFGVSFLAALFNMVFGVIIAWVLVRYDFPGRRLFDAIVDLPSHCPPPSPVSPSPPFTPRTDGSGRCSRPSASVSPIPRWASGSRWSS